MGPLPAPADIKPIILICGFGRCGTSLVMQMLAAAGIPTTGHAPTYEEKPPKGADAAFWVEHYAGRAIKVLDPHVRRPPAGLAYRAIWLDRDPRQQALSQIKLLTGLSYKIQSPLKVAVKKFEKHNAIERPRAVAFLRGLAGPENCMRVAFEDLINAPHIASKQIFDHFRDFSMAPAERADATVLHMASKIRFRHSDNYPGVLEPSLPGVAEEKSAA